jgi:hypothetical protein
MCNLYSITKGPQAIREFARDMRPSMAPGWHCHVGDFYL